MSSANPVIRDGNIYILKRYLFHKKWKADVIPVWMFMSSDAYTAQRHIKVIILLAFWCGVCFWAWFWVWLPSMFLVGALLLFERSDKVVVFLPKKLNIHPRQQKLPVNVCVCKWRRVREWFMHFAEGGDGDRMSRSSGLRPLWDQSHKKVEAGCSEFTWVWLFFFFFFFFSVGIFWAWTCGWCEKMTVWLFFFFLTLDFSEVYRLKTQYQSCSAYVCIKPFEPYRSSLNVFCLSPFMVIWSLSL